MTLLTVGAFGGVFVPYNMGYKTNLVTDVADELLFTQYHLVSPNTVDIMRLTIPIVAGASYYVVYVIMNFTNHHLSDYIVKMSYSKDKVVFIIYIGTSLCQKSWFTRIDRRRSLLNGTSWNLASISQSRSQCFEFSGRRWSLENHLHEHTKYYVGLQQS